MEKGGLILIFQININSQVIPLIFSKKRACGFSEGFSFVKTYTECVKTKFLTLLCVAVTDSVVTVVATGNVLVLVLVLLVLSEG